MSIDSQLSIHILNTLQESYKRLPIFLRTDALSINPQFKHRSFLLNVTLQYCEFANFVFGTELRIRNRNSFLMSLSLVARVTSTSMIICVGLFYKFFKYTETLAKCSTFASRKLLHFQ